MDPEPTGVGVFEIEDGSGLWEVGGYFLEPPDEVMLEVFAAAFGAKPFALSELPEVDWVAHVRRELAPVDAGRFFVFGSHDADKVPAGRGAACRSRRRWPSAPATTARRWAACWPSTGC